MLRSRMSDLRHSYERDGFVAGGALLSDAEVETLRGEFDRMFAASLRGERPHHRRFEDDAGGEYYAVYQLHRYSAAFNDVLRHPRLIELLSEVTGLDAFRVLADQVQDKPPRSGGRNGWHRDMPSFPLIRPYTALTAWIALDDASEENGCMVMVPGSHLWGDASDVAGDGWGLKPPRETYHGHVVRKTPCPVRKGGVHLHNDLVWHCSMPNTTVHKRRGLAILYIGAHERYRSGGRITYDLSDGSTMESVAPILVSTSQ